MVKICSLTVMDETDPEIRFDNRSISNHYWDFKNNIEPNWLKNSNGELALSKMVDEIKKNGEGKEYDCLIGLSGGLDSSYLLHKAVTEFGLRPLVFHVDGGWNSKSAVKNIKNLIDVLNLDLFTEVIDWNEMKSFQLALFKSGVPHLDIPQDMAFIATLYKYCEQHKIKYILNGGNISTESVLMPLKYLYWGTDLRHLKDIFSKFGPVELNTYPFVSAIYTKFYIRYIKHVKILKPLNFMNFQKISSENELIERYNWKPFSQKHFESRFTRFYEGFWLPTRFGYDMRKNQYSSLILSNQMSRADALGLLNEPPLSSDEVRNEFKFVANKLEISVDELTYLHQMKKKYYFDFKNSKVMFDIGEAVLSFVNGSRRGGAI
ncbi:N-acetyl sugar amidotransferase [Amylibacter sp.]|nr:N-acetyl sugar amidotransferase [Amylibacter sp.]